LAGAATFAVTTTGDVFQWEESTDGGTTWITLVDGGNYSGTITANLTVSNLAIPMINNVYRVMVNSIAFTCDPITTSLTATFVNTLVDTDGDGVFDLVDEDDDNDGILDTDEGDATDTNGNGIFDRLELDADSDGCNDVIEAGYTDGDLDGILGTSPVIVDPITGRITDDANGAIGGNGFTTPNDLNGNGIFDFQEIGTASNITTQPVDAVLVLGDDAIFNVTGNATYYQWQESTDNGSNWNNIIDGGIYGGATTTTLTITAPPEIMTGFVYRAQLTSPDFACDPNPILNSSGALLFINVLDWDNDGVFDINDLDDDNDGIADVDEYVGLPPLGDSDDPFGPEYDIDGDGIPNQFDNDSDGDNCFDVTEAGFTDNGFGMLGTLNPPNVDANGMVTSASDGYAPPNDLDNNGVDDFMEAGTGATINSDPLDQDFILNGSATFTVTASGDTYQWEESTDGVNWTTLVDGGDFAGTTTASLTVSSSSINNYFSSYRAVVSNIAYACDPEAVSLTATYNTLTDTDNDGVFDIVDLDADNDGIYDTVEGEFTDSNLDGIPDKLSLDADSDTCADVVEAGFDDPDGDGILGTSPVSVDAEGVVTGQGGYTTPNDLNANGVFDFQEAGSATVINNEPEDATIALGSDAVFEVSGNATFYQWQESVTGGTSWVNLSNDALYTGVDTDRLRIIAARGRLEGNMYRVLMTSPDFACDPNPEVFSNEVRLIFNTELIPSGFSPNGDGNNDLFLIPGLIETPNFTMEVFDRWGNSVYKYANNGNLSPDWWDGNSTGNMTLSKGTRVPAGTYFYNINYNDGNKTPSKGWVYVTY